MNDGAASHRQPFAPPCSPHPPPLPPPPTPPLPPPPPHPRAKVMQHRCNYCAIQQGFERIEQTNAMGHVAQMPLMLNEVCSQN